MVAGAADMGGEAVSEIRDERSADAGVMGARKFLDAFMDAPAGADIEMRRAIATDDPNMVLVITTLSCPGRQDVCMAQIVSEVLAFADICEKLTHRFPRFAAEFANLIMGLRAAADKAVRENQ